MDVYRRRSRLDEETLSHEALTCFGREYNQSRCSLACFTPPAFVLHPPLDPPPNGSRSQIFKPPTSTFVRKGRREKVQE